MSIAPRSDGSALAELRLFGGVRLEGRLGPLGKRVLQRRPIAVLAVLGAARGTGITRDKLLGLIWGDADDRQARHQLSDALYAIRHDLAEDAVLDAGGGLVLNTDRVWCDAAVFDAAAAAGDDVAAVDTYTGPFLDGFYVDGLAAFEQWRAAEQRRYAAACQAALERLARDAAGSGDHAAAAHWWERAVLHDPYNSRTVLALMRALVEAGDPANALQHLRTHERVLRDELDVAPDDDVVAFGDAVRERLAATASRGPPSAGGRAPGGASVPVRSAPAAVVDDATAAAPAAAASQPPRAWWRSRRARVAGIVVGAVIASVVLRGWMVGERAPPGLDSDLIAVVPFQTVGEGLEMWSEGVMDLLYHALDGAGPLQGVEPSRLLDSRPDAVRIGESAALARSVGAGLLVSGTVFASGADSVRLIATLFDAHDRAAGARFEALGSLQNVPALADTVAVDMLEHLTRSRGLAGVDLQSIGSRNPRALREFLIGEQLYRRFQKDSAVNHFRRATELDSTFALAYSRWAWAWRLARRAEDRRPNTDELAGWGRLRLRAGRLNNGLAQRESLLIAIDSLEGALLVARMASEGQYVWDYQPLLVRLEETVRFAEDLYPDDPDRKLRSGWIRWYWAPLFGTSRWEAYQAALTMVAADSSHLEFYDMLFEHMLLYGDVDAALNYLDTYLRKAPADWEMTRQTRVVRRLLEQVRSDSALAWDLLDSLARRVRAGDELARRTMVTIRDITMWWPDDEETIVHFARIVQDPWILLCALLYRGHVREAREVYHATLYQTAPWTQANALMDLSVFGAVPLSEEYYREGEAHLPTATPVVFVYSQVLWAFRRDSTFLLRLLDRWRELERSNDSSDYRMAFEHGTERYVMNATEAYLALVRGDTAEAIDRLSRYRWPVYLASECFLLGQLLAAQGRLALADDTFRRCQTRADSYASGPDVYLALHWARVLEARGKDADARREYRFVADVWRNADPELQPYVQEALTALARLER